MSRLLDGSNILVTGGTGSLGKALVMAMLGGHFGSPERIVVFSRDEAKQHDMRMQIKSRSSATDDLIYQDHSARLRFRIGDVRSLSDISRALDGIDVVINAAALKQVPTCEYFPEQAIATNCVGAENVIEAIRTTPNRVKTVIGVSTDKACEPTNVMGMTKALQERLFIAANTMCTSVRFVAVRYGNILASRGSVVPMFLEQISRNRPVTVTSNDMTRFLMPLEYAVETVFEALREALPGEIVVRAAPALSVRTVAKFLIGDKQVPISVIGIRPGEKIHETLVTQEESLRAARIGEYIYVAPMLPELEKRRPVKSGQELNGALTSSKGVLGEGETAALFARWNFTSMSSDLRRKLINGE